MSVNNLCRNYLVVIDSMQNEGGAIRSVSIAKHVKCSKANINYVIGKLKEAGYVEQERYGQVSLTQKGMQEAEEINRRRQLIHSFLLDSLGINKNCAADQATAIEPHIFKEVLQKIKENLKEASEK